MILSPSNINSFCTCPFQWKLINIDNVQTTKIQNTKAELGGYVHSCIKKYFDYIPQKPTEKSIKHCASIAFTALPSHLSIHKKLYEDIIKNFITFEKSRLTNYRKPILCEEKLTTEKYVGIIDYFDGENIIDWKTGTLMSITDNERRQGKIYETLLRENNYLTSTPKIFFVTLKNGRVLQLPLTTEAWLEQQRTHILTSIEKNIYPKHFTPLCNWCPVQIRCEFENTPLIEEDLLNQIPLPLW